MRIFTGAEHRVIKPRVGDWMTVGLITDSGGSGGGGGGGLGGLNPATLLPISLKIPTDISEDPDPPPFLR